MSHSNDDRATSPPDAANTKDAPIEETLPALPPPIHPPISDAAAKMAHAEATQDFSAITLMDVAEIIDDRTQQQRMFPVILHRILSINDYSDALVWLPDGKSFAIVNKKKFCSKVSSLHFCTENYELFVAWLRAFGFEEIEGGEFDTFRQARFLETKPWLAHTMQSMSNIIAIPRPNN